MRSFTSLSSRRQPHRRSRRRRATSPRPADGSRAHVVIGQVVGIHIADEVISEGIIDVKKLDPLARLGYLDYARLDLDNMFSLRPPGGDHRFDGR